MCFPTTRVKNRILTTNSSPSDHDLYLDSNFTKLSQLLFILVQINYNNGSGGGKSIPKVTGIPLFYD